jgi:hypothetical protein
MSITINKQPQDLMPVYNQMVIAVTGSYQTFSNHQFVIDLKCNNVDVSRLKVPANPEGYGVFDIHKHIENRISYDFDPNLVGLYVATQSFATYSVSFGEQFRFNWGFVDNYFVGGAVGFIGPSGGARPLFATGSEISVAQITPFSFSSYEGDAIITSIQFITASNAWVVGTNKGFEGNSPAQGGTMSLSNFGLTTVNSTQSIAEKYAWNGVFNYLDFINYDQTDYIPNTSTFSEWLTNVPMNWEMDIMDRMWLLAYKTGNGQQRTLVVQSDNGVFTYASPYSLSVSGIDRYRLVGAGVGPWNLITSTAGWVAASGAFPIIDTDTATYSVFYRNSGGAQDTKTLVFKIGDRCSKYEKIQLNFMDKKGSFVPFTFNLVNRQNKSISRVDYQQIYGNYAPAAQAWNYNPWDRGKKNLDTVVSEVYTITSDWINQNQSNYLMELFESPEVYWINEDGITVAVNITTNQVERKQVINDQLINYQLTFELSNKNNQQRG